MRLNPALIIIFVLVVLLQMPADATVKEWLMEMDGFSSNQLPSTPSVRLSGIGDLSICIADESNELNAHDFGRNIAGLLNDGDGWTINTWMTGFTSTQDVPGVSSEHRYGSAGSQVVYRSSKRALGLDVNWTYYEATTRPGDWTRTRGPLKSFVMNEAFGPDLVLGVKIGVESENEDRQSDDFFNIRHGQDRWVGQFGAEYYLGDINLSASWHFKRGEVKGKASDANRFIEDTYTWICPEDRFILASVIPLGNLADCAVRLSMMDREGGEDVEISWSAESPTNPSNENFSAEATTFSEEKSDFELTNQWRFYLSSDMLLGLEASYSKSKWDVVEGLNFKGSNLNGNWETTSFTMKAGISQRIFKNILVGLQLNAQQAKSETSPDPEEATSRRLTGNIGFEYFISEAVILRGGFQKCSYDRNIDEPVSLSQSHLITAGLSWVPRGGLFQINSAFSVGQSRPYNDYATMLRDIDEVSYLIGFRMLL